MLQSQMVRQIQDAVASLMASCLIGRRFKDSTLQEDIKLLPFRIVDKGSKPFVSVKVPRAGPRSGPKGR